MKTLTLLRHAKSGHDPQIARDFDRALNAKGKRAAWLMGQHAWSLGLTFDRCVASPAVRVVETLEAFAGGYGETLSPEWDRRIYLASALTLLDVVQAMPDSVDNVLLSGHNPGLEDLALLLACDGELRRCVEAKLPTGSIVQLASGDDWRDWREGCVTMTHFVRPRDLDATLGPDSD